MKRMNLLKKVWASVFIFIFLTSSTLPMPVLALAAEDAINPIEEKVVEEVREEIEETEKQEVKKDEDVANEKDAEQSPTEETTPKSEEESTEEEVEEEVVLVDGETAETAETTESAKEEDGDNTTGSTTGDTKDEDTETTTDNSSEEPAEVESESTDTDTGKEEIEENKYADVEWKEGENGSMSIEVSKELIKENKEVSFEYKESGFKIIFSELEKDGVLTIKEIKLTEKEKKEMNSLSDFAYDVTLVDTDGKKMEEGTFKYDLVFPIAKDKQDEKDLDIKVKYAEKLDELVEEQESTDVVADEKIELKKSIEIKKDVKSIEEVVATEKVEDKKEINKDAKSVIIKNLDHFTVFIVTDDNASYSAIWKKWLGTQGYQNNGVHYPTSGIAGETATWNFSSIDSGNYGVYVSWSTHSNRTTAAPYELTYLNSATESKNINQEQLADQATTGGPGQWSGWYHYGNYNLDTSSKLVLTGIENDNRSEYVIADEVLLVRRDIVWVDDGWANKVNGEIVTVDSEDKFIGYNAFSTIQAGIDQVQEGGEVVVASGLYYLDEQIVIEKDITIKGAGAKLVRNGGTILRARTNTGTNHSDDKNSRFLVEKNVEFNLRGVILSGGSKNDVVTESLIITYGTGTLKNNIFRNVKGRIYTGRGIAVYGDVVIKNNKFENIQRIGVHIRKAYDTGIYGENGPIGTAKVLNNTYEGKGVGDWLDYGIEVGAASYAKLEGNKITNCKGVASVDGSKSAGILATDWYGVGTTVDIHKNTLKNNSNGIFVGYGEGDKTIANINQNKFIKNTATGLATTKNVIVDATNNWWGDASGPKDTDGTDGSTPSKNVTGKGNSVVGNVSYCPWLKTNKINKTGNKNIAGPCIPELQAEYKLDSCFDTAIASDETTSYDGELKNKPTWTAGYNGQGLEFDGEDDYIDLGDGVDLGTMHTISTWVNLGSSDIYKDTIFGEEHAKYAIQFRNPRQMIYNAGEGNTSNSYEFKLKEEDKLTVGDWYHMTIVRSDKDMKLFINGVLKDSGVLTGDGENGLTIKYIGKKRDGSDGYNYSFTGKLDEIKFYKGTLSNTEVKSLYEGYGVNSGVKCPICGDGIVNQDSEQCDGTDGVKDNEFCTNQCKLVPVYEHTGSACADNEFKSFVGEISLDSHDKNNKGELTLKKDKKYLLESSGTYKWANKENHFSDTAYDSSNNFLTVRANTNVDKNRGGVGAIIGDLGRGMGIIKWDNDTNINEDHIYSRLIQPAVDTTTEFLISDWYSDWYGHACDNQNCLGDNTGKLTVKLFECIEDTIAPTGAIDKIKYTNKGVVMELDKFITNWKTPVIIGTASDNTEVVSVVLNIDGHDYTAIVTDDDWEATVTNNLSDGLHEMAVVITDMAGNETVIKKEINIDTIIPTVKYTYHKNGEDIDGDVAYLQNLGQLTFDATYSDDNSGLNKDVPVIFDTKKYPKAYCGWNQFLQEDGGVPLSGLSDDVSGQSLVKCTASLEEGEYFTRHRVYDNSTRSNAPKVNQHKQVNGVKFVIDRTAPVTGLTLQADLHEGKNVAHNQGWRNFGWYENFDYLKLNVETGDTESDIIKYQVLSGDVACPAIGDTDYVGAAGVTDVSSNVNNTDGIYSVCYYGEDAAGNIESLHKDVVRRDDTRGVTEILERSGVYNAINNAHYQNTDKITISFKSSDAESGIARARAYLYNSFDQNESTRLKNTSDFINDTVQTEGGVNQYAFTSNSLSDGEYSYHIWGYDKAQNWTNFEDVPFVIDTQVPAKVTDIRILDHKNIDLGCGGNTNNRTITVDWDDNNDSNFDYFNYETRETWKTTVSVSHRTGMISDNDGEYKYRVQAVDKAGNEGEFSDWCYVTLDRTAPELTVDSVELKNERHTPATVYQDIDWKHQENMPMIVGTTSDLSGVQEVKIVVNGQTYIESDIIGGGEWKIKITEELPEGINKMIITSTDIAGNQKTITQDIFIDTKAPTADYRQFDGENEVTGTIAYVNSLSRLSFTGEYTDENDTEIEGGTSAGLFTDSYVIFEAQDDGSFSFSADGKKAFCSWRSTPNLVNISSADTFSLTEKISFSNCRNGNSLETGELPDGEYYMTHHVYDDATRKDIPSIKHFRDVLGLHFVVDTQAPVTNQETLSVDTYITNKSFKITGTTTDDSGVAGINVYYKKSSEPDTEYKLAGKASQTNSDIKNFEFEYIWTPDADGVYDIKVAGVDIAGNKESSAYARDLVYDITDPTVNQLEDKNYLLEGQDAPIIAAIGADNHGLKEFCATITGPVGEFLPGGFKSSCVAVESGITEYTWENVFGFPAVLDTSIMPEGKYTVSYYVEDEAGNRSGVTTEEDGMTCDDVEVCEDVQYEGGGENMVMEGVCEMIEQCVGIPVAIGDKTVTYTLANVAPSISFEIEDNDINEDSHAKFIASFIDPSSNDAGDGIHDDQNWTATIYYYGNNNEQDSFVFTEPGVITIPKYKYRHDGNFDVKLTVCESATNLSSERICTTVTRSIEIDDIDENDDSEDDSDNGSSSDGGDDNAPTYYRATGVTTGEQVETLNEDGEVVVDAEDTPETAGAQDENKDEDNTEVKGEASCKEGWPLWAWLLVLLAGGIGTYFIGKMRNEKVILPVQAAAIAGIFALWYFVDGCGSFKFVPYADVIGGFAIVGALYNQRTKLKE